MISFEESELERDEIENDVLENEEFEMELFENELLINELFERELLINEDDDSRIESRTESDENDAGIVTVLQSKSITTTCSGTKFANSGRPPIK
jgi:hypothetical protein